MGILHAYGDPLNNNVPIYVGKGKGTGKGEPWAHQHTDSRFCYNHKRWRDADQQFAPEIVAEFENEDDAYRLEAELIFKYGRSDQGTGTLLNWLMADG